MFHAKVVGIEKTFPTIPHMTAFRTVFLGGHNPIPSPAENIGFTENCFREQNTYNIILKPPTVRTLIVTKIEFFLIFFSFHPLPKKFGGGSKNARDIICGECLCFKTKGI